MKTSEMEKEGKNRSQYFGFLSHIMLDTLKVYTKSEDTGSHRC